MSLGALQIVDTFEGGMTQYLLDSSWKSRFDRVHQELECCGVTNYEDWLNVRWIPIRLLKPTVFNQEYVLILYVVLLAKRK